MPKKRSRKSSARQRQAAKRRKQERASAGSRSAKAAHNRVPRHKNRFIRGAVKYAASKGWRVVLAPGHAWGRIYCPEASREGCTLSVWSTPRNPEVHALQIREVVDNCPHKPGKN